MLTAVAAVTHAVLNEPASGNTESAETKIVAFLKSLEAAKSAEEENQIEMELNSLLQELGVNKCRFTLLTGNSIESYFICDSGEQLKELRGHYESGLMKAVLERIFTLLAKETITIRDLKWPTEEYDDRLLQIGKIIYNKSLMYSLCIGCILVSFCHLVNIYIFHLPLCPSLNPGMFEGFPVEYLLIRDTMYCGYVRYFM
jgi:hypothetical protein